MFKKVEYFCVKHKTLKDLILRRLYQITFFIFDDKTWTFIMFLLNKYIYS